MAFENRDYARREGDSDQGWTRALKWLIAANVALYLVSFLATKAVAGFGPGELYALFALVPDQVVHGHRLWELVTSSFVHDIQNPFHLIVNMYVLWVAGRDLELAHGPRRLLAVYFGAAVAAALLYLGVALLRPELRSAPLLGASAAALAVLAVHASEHQGEKILLFLLFEVPLWAGVVAMAGIDLLLVGHATEAGAAAAGCFVGGAAVGFSAHALRERSAALAVRVAPRATASRSAPRRVPAASPAAAPPPASTLEAELDLVLKKIHEKGMAGLTDDEKGVLERASQHYRGKR